jgi:hypothetical protein
VLGLQPRCDLGPRHYALSLVPCALSRAEGTLPLPDGQGVIRVTWTREADGVHFQLQTPQPIFLHVDGERTGMEPDILRVEEKTTVVIPAASRQ